MNLDFNLADFFKLPTKIMFAIALASGLILFLPDSIVTKMYMVDFRNKIWFCYWTTISNFFFNTYSYSLGKRIQIF